MTTEDIVSFDHYQTAAFATARYPDKGTGGMTALAYVGLGLGEAGEVQGKIKKILRDDSGVITDAHRQQITAELGDVLWYVAACASELGVPLSDIAAANVEKLASRASRGVIGGSGDNR